MSDRELLQAAAKAAGIELQFARDPASRKLLDYMPPRRKDTWENWNPLTDDGDALRLACALKLNIAQGDFSVSVDDEADVDEAMFVPSDDKRCEVVRRVIVQAAAAMGTETDALRRRKD
jgi:hypothetical protein